MSHVVQQVAAARPDLLRNSCQEHGGSWGFMDVLVDTLRTYDTRWGYNWKRGNVGDPSHDVVNYHWGAGASEGSTQVYIIDVIVGHCGSNPAGRVGRCDRRDLQQRQHRPVDGTGSVLADTSR
jgi:hypothetical protein